MPRVVLGLLVVLNGVSIVSSCVARHWVEHVAVATRHHHLLFGEGAVALLDAQLSFVVTPWVELGARSVGLLCPEHHEGVVGGGPLGLVVVAPVGDGELVDGGLVLPRELLEVDGFACAHILDDFELRLVHLLSGRLRLD